MTECNFCGKDFEQGTGKMYVKADGKIFHFCSSKCEKNQINLGRKPRKTRWTKEYHELKAAQKK